jgi:hypothetical protein
MPLLSWNEQWISILIKIISWSKQKHTMYNHCLWNHNVKFQAWSGGDSIFGGREKTMLNWILWWQGGASFTFLSIIYCSIGILNMLIPCCEITVSSFKHDHLMIVFEEKENTMLNWILWWQCKEFFRFLLMVYSSVCSDAPNMLIMPASSETLF